MKGYTLGFGGHWMMALYDELATEICAYGELDFVTEKGQEFYITTAGRYAVVENGET